MLRFQTYCFCNTVMGGGLCTYFHSLCSLFHNLTNVAMVWFENRYWSLLRSICRGKNGSQYIWLRRRGENLQYESKKVKPVISLNKSHLLSKKSVLNTFWLICFCDLSFYFLMIYEEKLKFVRDYKSVTSYKFKHQPIADHERLASTPGTVFSQIFKHHCGVSETSRHFIKDVWYVGC